MSLKILFYGFRHSHINSLYKKVCSSALAEVAGCIEPNAEAREKAERLLGATFSDLSYEDWLHSDIDAVAVGTAYGERGEAIIKALEAGKHVIADKPICTELCELECIRELARNKGLKIACMLDLRYTPQSVKAKEIIQSGRLGEVRNVSFNGQHCIDYANRPSWYFEAGKHGGTLNDIAIHGVDLVRMITGLDFSRTHAARCWNAYADRNKDFEDCATFMAELSNGAGVLADVSYSAPTHAFRLPTYWEFRFWCDRGMLQLSYNDKQITLVEEGVELPMRIDCPDAPEGYLSEFISEIERGDSAVTENLLASTEQTLRIQQVSRGREGL